MVAKKAGDEPPDATARPPVARRQPGHTAPSCPAGSGAECAAGRQPAIKRHAVLWSARKIQSRLPENRGRVNAPECTILTITTAPMEKPQQRPWLNTARQQIILFLRHNAAMPVYDEIPSHPRSCPLAPKGQRVQSNTGLNELVHTACPHLFEQAVCRAAFVQGHFIQFFIQQTLTHAAGIGGGVVQQKLHK